MHEPYAPLIKEERKEVTTDKHEDRTRECCEHNTNETVRNDRFRFAIPFFTANDHLDPRVDNDAHRRAHDERKDKIHDTLRKECRCTRTDIAIRKRRANRLPHLIDTGAAADLRMCVFDEE